MDPRSTLDHLTHHRQHLIRDLRLDHPMGREVARGGDDMTGRIANRRHKMWMRGYAPCSEGRGGDEQLDGRNGDPLTEPNILEGWSVPPADRPDDPRRFTGQIDSGGGAEPKLPDIVVESLLADAGGHLRGADIA